MEDAPSPNTLLRHPSDVKDVTLPRRYRDKIDNNYDALLSDVDLLSILPKLRQHGVITEEQFEELWREKQPRQARKNFLTILPTRGRDAYLWFCHTLLKKAEQEFLFKLLVDEEAVMLINKLVEADEEERRLNSAAAEDVMLSLMSSPIGSQSNETHSHAFLQRDQTVPKSLEMSFSSAREDSTTVQAVQPQDSSLVAREGGLYHPVQETDTPSPIDPHVTDLKTAAGGAVGVRPQEEEMGEVVADFPEPSSGTEHAREKRTNETSGPSDPEPEGQNRGSVEGDFPVDEEYEITAADPGWVQGLREYQKELAEPGIRGDNYIICATTGSGKTMAAAYVVYHHLRRFGNKARVVFFAPTVALVRQQFQEFRKWFSGQKVDYLVGPETDDKADVEVMIKFNEITVLTPAIFHTALTDPKRIAGLHLVTMMIFDECHHTHGENIYNKIMGRYINNKVLLQRGELNIPPRLPQIVGITASLGVGDAKADESAVQFILQKCANLDARRIAVVKRNKEELAKFVNEPTEDMKTIPGRKDDPFSKTVLAMMTMVEDKIRHTPATEKVALTDLEFPERKDTLIYLSFLSNIMWKITNLPPGDYNRRSIISCLEYLTCYHKVLTLHDEARAKDALNLLQRMLDLRADSVMEGDLTETWLENMYRDRWNKLKQVSENPAYANPKLVELKKMILAAFQEDEETYAILFTKTKISTEALKNWVNEDPDLQRFRAMRLTGASSEDSAGMSSRVQQEVVQNFKLGKSRLLIATSVAEEGLDIKACNCVFRYNYTTNEIGRVQAKGRARREDSKYHTITDEDKQHLEYREKMNLYREGLMRIAVDKISKMDPADYEDQIWRYQGRCLPQCMMGYFPPGRYPLGRQQPPAVHAGIWSTSERDAYMERLAKERLREAKLRSKSEETFLVCCYRCDQVVCRSTELVCLHKTHHTIIDPELDSLIKVKKHRRPQKFGLMRKLNKVYCKSCQCDWGIIVNYRERVNMPILKSSGFAYFKMLDDGSRGERVSVTSNKKWDDAPCGFRNVFDEEIYRSFKGKVYTLEY